MNKAYKKISSLRFERFSTDPNRIFYHVINHYRSLFTSSPTTINNGLIEGVIPCLINDNINNMFTLVLSFDEIKNVVFNLTKDGSLGPNGFGGFFLQEYWNIIQTDVYNAVMELFTNKWLPLNMNFNNVSLFPKTSKADTLNQSGSLLWKILDSKSVRSLQLDLLKFSLI